MLNGPSFIPENTKKAIIFFHGYGADGSDLFSLNGLFQKELKNTAFFTPNAPTTTYVGGYEWFSLDDYFSQQNLDLNYLKTLQERSEKVIPIVDEYITKIQQETNLERKNIFIGGFSQGGLIASQIVFQSKELFNGLILMSPVPPAFINEKVNQTPIILTRGTLDTIIPEQASQLTKPLFQEKGFSITEIIEPTIGHGIGENHIKHIIQFINTHI